MYGIKWRKPYHDEAGDAALGAAAATVNNEEPVTIASFGQEADINNMMRRFSVTGELRTRAQQPLYGDFTSAPDFREAQDVVLRAQGEFMALPPLVRERFANDPAELLTFISKGENFDEAVRLGLLPAKEAAPVNSSAGSPPKAES